MSNGRSIKRSVQRNMKKTSIFSKIKREWVLGGIFIAVFVALVVFSIWNSIEGKWQKDWEGHDIVLDEDGNVIETRISDDEMTPLQITSMLYTISQYNSNGITTSNSISTRYSGVSIDPGYFDFSHSIYGEDDRIIEVRFQNYSQYQMDYEMDEVANLDQVGTTVEIVDDENSTMYDIVYKDHFIQSGYTQTTSVDDNDVLHYDFNFRTLDNLCYFPYVDIKVNTSDIHKVADPSIIACGSLPKNIKQYDRSTIEMDYPWLIDPNSSEAIAEGFNIDVNISFISSYTMCWADEILALKDVEGWDFREGSFGEGRWNSTILAISTPKNEGCKTLGEYYNKYLKDVHLHWYTWKMGIDLDIGAEYIYDEDGVPVSADDVKSLEKYNYGIPEGYGEPDPDPWADLEGLDVLDGTDMDSMQVDDSGNRVE